MHAGEKAARYHDRPMHPTYTADRPGSCPICGMALTVIADDHASGAPGDSGHAAAPGVEGLAAVDLTDQQIQLTGIRTATAQEGELPRRCARWVR